jgi:hypothetical protein
MLLAAGSRGGRLGVDFSSNLSSNFELHVELAYIADESKVTLDASHRLLAKQEDAVNGLLGLRYLTASDVTWIVEYYHHGSGYSEAELQRFLSLAKSDPSTSPVLFELAQAARQSGFAAPNAGEDYLHLRASRKEPFGVVYSAVGLTTIANLEDESFSMTPELVYTGLGNSELRLRMSWLEGSRNTEFGEKLSDRRLELRFRYFF